MKVRIYQPAKTAMQSGVNKKDWLLEFEAEKKRYVEPLMGWTGSADTKQQLKLKFETKEQAIEYAQSKGLEYSVREPKKRKHIKKSYADNFAYKAD